MKVDNKNGLLENVQFKPSPNQDERPDPADVAGIILHNISLPPNEFGGRYIDDLFLNQLDCSIHPYFESLQGLHVSSHLLIRRDGEVVQFVPFHQRAWHAGLSYWLGRERCNDFTIGIELEGCDSQAFDERQYPQLVRVIQALFEAYPLLDIQRITGHEHIAPGRKTDPGPYFDWQRLWQELKARQ